MNRVVKAAAWGAGMSLAVVAAGCGALALVATRYLEQTKKPQPYYPKNMRDW